MSSVNKHKHIHYCENETSEDRIFAFIFYQMLPVAVFMACENKHCVIIVY